MNELTVLSRQRELQEVTRDIRIQTGMFLRTAIEIGRLLFVAKEMVEPGSWGTYIEQELPFSHAWANNYMRLYKEFGGDQVSLFGDNQAYMKLRPSQALELLALPADSREEFMQTHDVEDMSTRQLRQEIQEELDKERKAHAATQEDLGKVKRTHAITVTALEETRAALRDAEQDNLDLQQTLAAVKDRDVGWEEEISRLKEKAAEAEQKSIAVQKNFDELTAKAKAAEDKEKEAKKKLKEFQKDPKLTQNVMEQLRQEAQAAADAKAAETARKDMEKLRRELEQAETARVAAEKNLANAQKAAQISSADAAVFKLLFEKVQDDFNELNNRLIRIDANDPELGGKLKNAVRALLDKMLTEV